MSPSLYQEHDGLDDALGELSFCVGRSGCLHKITIVDFDIFPDPADADTERDQISDKQAECEIDCPVNVGEFCRTKHGVHEADLCHPRSKACPSQTSANRPALEVLLLAQEPQWQDRTDL